MREWHSQSHVPMVLQISGRVGAKVSETLGLRLDSVWDWEHHPRSVPTARRGICWRDTRCRTMCGRSSRTRHMMTADTGVSRAVA